MFLSNLSTARNFEFDRLANLPNSKLRAVDRLERVFVRMCEVKQTEIVSVFEVFAKVKPIEICSFIQVKSQQFCENLFGALILKKIKIENKFL